MFSFPEPKTIEEARRQILTAERARQSIKEGYTFWDEEGFVYVCKPGQDAFTYYIVNGVCNCPDFTHRGEYCKHTVAWDWWKNNVTHCRLERCPATGEYSLSIVTKEDEEAQAAEDAMIAEYEALYADCEDETFGCDPFAEF